MVVGLREKAQQLPGDLSFEVEEKGEKKVFVLEEEKLLSTNVLGFVRWKWIGR